MATIKSFSDLEQSKMLAEILPLESADMCFNTRNNMPPLMTSYSRFNEFFNMEPTPAFLIPCWSLAALLGVLPKGYSLGRSKNGKYYACMTFIRHDISEFDNPIDACVDLILKLHELNLL